MKMMSVIAVTPKEGTADEITDLIVQSRADGVDGLDVYSIVHTREDQLLVVNEWESIDAFMEYVNEPHNMIELIEHLCDRFDEEDVCKAYSGMIMHQENSALPMRTMLIALLMAFASKWWLSNLVGI